MEDFGSILVMTLSFGATFVAARLLSRRFRQRRRERDEAARRAGESRQVRRARERKGR